MKKGYYIRCQPGGLHKTETMALLYRYGFNGTETLQFWKYRTNSWEDCAYKEHCQFISEILEEAIEFLYRKADRQTGWYIRECQAEYNESLV